MNNLYELVNEILTRLKEVQERTARTETRLMRLAELMSLDLSKRKEKDLK